MAQHDYINKKPRPKKDAKPAKKPFPIVLVVIATALVGAFGFGLWYVKQHADPEQVKLAQHPTTQKNQPAVETKAEPPRMPDFIKEMKEHEVKVEVKEMEQGGPYQVRCGAFREYNQAETLKAKIAFTGLSSEVRRVEGKNGVWFIVRLGPYETKRLAEADKNRIKRSKIMGCTVLNWT
ncbi:SPOR domain-containing protein [Pseudoalteromonas xiamenensis]|jgi:cell division protein FtsN|uniref:SPOR domain-containing protein n=1 Tax=Pseudoalteromonas xiamenensis TaxID=882626 RepID=A0A975HK06_9GAMM|nr:SPOR domain-containing protein [Pseudoalteromonas xiamenensis]QTH70538.1 SPOR domain-containing protein [Pseudoalteromonas xiamenensis]